MQESDLKYFERQLKNISPLFIYDYLIKIKIFNNILNIKFIL